MKQLNETNRNIEETLQKLENTPSENEQSDELVSNLLVLIGERQNLLDSIDDSDVEIARKTLQQQIVVGEGFEKRAKNVLKHIQSLLQARKKNQRQINIYQSVDSNK
ncbi:flagella biosynthesis chaperone for FliD, FliT [uncultured Shewanella sp.]|uniref:flagella biosynthesis chaperone for FliD, FliT n=1 Tax=uncultured Shewanella sp. TaxID=173975 RepID=UPI00260D3838|nr:flagella biosynthesis chaperone for FliD, FliT [uncultured Shewanella sp.]